MQGIFSLSNWKFENENFLSTDKKKLYSRPYKDRQPIAESLAHCLYTLSLSQIATLFDKKFAINASNCGGATANLKATSSSKARNSGEIAAD